MRKPYNTQPLVPVPRANVYEHSTEYYFAFSSDYVDFIYNTPSNPTKTTFILSTTITINGVDIPKGVYTVAYGMRFKMPDNTIINKPSSLFYINTENGGVYEVKDFGVSLSNCSLFLQCPSDVSGITLLTILGGFDVDTGKITNKSFILDVANPLTNLQENAQGTTTTDKYLSGNVLIYNEPDSNVYLYGGIYYNSDAITSGQHYYEYEEDTAQYWSDRSYSITLSGTYAGKDYKVSVSDITSTTDVPSSALTSGANYAYPTGTYAGHSVQGIDGYSYIVPAKKAVNLGGSPVAQDSTVIYSVINSNTQNVHMWDMPSCEFPSGTYRTLPVCRSDSITAELGFLQPNGTYFYYNSASESVSYCSVTRTTEQSQVFTNLTNGLCFGVSTSLKYTDFNIMFDEDNAKIVILNSNETVIIKNLASFQTPTSPVLPEKAGVLVPDLVKYSVTSPNTGNEYTKEYLKPAKIYIHLARRIIPERPAERMRVEVSNIGKVWSASTNYSLGDVVKYNGKVYISGKYNNTGNTPDSSPRYEWIDIDDPVFDIPDKDFFRPMDEWNSSTTYNIGDEVIVKELGLRYKATEDGLVNIFPPDEENSKWAPFGPVNELIPFDNNPVTVFKLSTDWGGISIIYETPESIIKGVAGIGINGGIITISTFVGNNLREGEKSIIDESKDNYLHLLAPEIEAPYYGCTTGSQTDFTPRTVEVKISRPSKITEEPLKISNLLIGKYHSFTYSEFSLSVQRKVKTSQKDIDGIVTISVPDSWYDIIGGTVRFGNLPDYQRAIRDLNRASGRYSLFYGGNSDYEFSNILSYGIVSYTTTASDPVTNTIKIDCQGVASAFVPDN